MINNIFQSSSNIESRIKNIQLRVNAIWYDMMMMFSLLMLSFFIFNSESFISSLVCLITFLAIAIAIQIMESNERGKIESGN